MRGSPQSFESNLLQIGAGYTSDGCNDSDDTRDDCDGYDTTANADCHTYRDGNIISFLRTGRLLFLQRTVARKYHLRALKACDQR